MPGPAATANCGTSYLRGPKLLADQRCEIADWRSCRIISPFPRFRIVLSEMHPTDNRHTRKLPDCVSSETLCQVSLRRCSRSTRSRFRSSTVFRLALTECGET